jgi:hypothetical protein
LAVVCFYGCKTWFLTLREEYRLRVFENRVLRSIFGTQMYEMLRGWITYLTESFKICTCRYKWSELVKKDEIIKTCSTHGSNKECILDVGKKTWRKESTRKT